MIKKKQLKAKACRWCNEQFTPRTSLQVVCGFVCALKYSNEKNVEIKIKGFKENLKTLSQYETEARTVFQQYIRQRDKDEVCISCGTNNSVQWDSGHYYNANQFSGLIFDENNCHKQCVTCNRHRHGNLIEYRKGLVQRYGAKFMIMLDELSDEKRNYKYTKDELEGIKKRYKSRLK